jgi:hypothetical protein
MYRKRGFTATADGIADDAPGVWRQRPGRRLRGVHGRPTAAAVLLRHPREQVERRILPGA